MSNFFQVSNSIISHGCFLAGCCVEHSVVGVRSRLEHGVELKVTCFLLAFISHEVSILFTFQFHLLDLLDLHLFWFKIWNQYLHVPNELTFSLELIIF